MQPQDFDTLSRIVKLNSGLVLTPDKTYLLESRLLPIARKWNLASVQHLAEHMRKSPHQGQIRDVVEAMTTNESSFFRDSKPFDLFREIMLPDLIKTRAPQRTLRIWSAASSSGQEAYSLAILLKERASELAGWTIEIVGTDLSSEMVDRAAAGIYSQFEVQRGLPAKFLIKYFKQTEDRWQVADDLRRMVRFRKLNLLNDLSYLGQFDIVFCRNVLIYFDLATKGKVLAAIANQMPLHGYLVLGSAETVMGVTDCFQPIHGQHGLYSPAKSRRDSGGAAC